MKRSRDDVLFIVGVALWVVVIAETWPSALSFGDEVGYLGRAKLLLDGHLGYVPDSLGVWLPTPNGFVGKYPLLQSLLLAPFLILTPRGGFALAVLAAVILAATARSVLKSWNKSPLWALLLLGHPTIVILARTDMADLPQAAAVVAGWWALRRGRAFATVAWLTVLVAIKPTGAVLALGVVAGEAASSARAVLARDPATWRRLAWGATGGIAGLALLLGLNHAATGKLWFSYDHSGLGTPPFWFTYLPYRVPAHLRTLLLDPPLLVAGAWSYWRRRELGPLLLAGGYLALMCFYYFVDTGLSALESLVLSARLILPTVAFLLIGYGAWLDDLLLRARARWSGDVAPAQAAPTPAWLAAALLALPLVITTAISVRHARFQSAMALVREVASGVADAHHERTLGVTLNACKAGLLHDGPTTLFDPVRNRPAAVFCSEVSASHRMNEGHRSCQFPGYHPVMSREGFFALARDDAGGDAR
jgi:hypothetical protein